MYSFVNVPTLVRDLARHPRGPMLTDDLLHAFALTPARLGALDAVAAVSATRRRALRPIVLAAARARPGCPDVAVSTTEYAGGDTATLVSSMTIGDVDALTRFVRDEVLHAAWQGDGELAVAVHPDALDVVSDALVAAWAEPCDATAVLRAPWEAARDGDVASGGDVAVASHPLVVDAVALLAPDVRAPVPPVTWPVHVHAACWAVHLTGRGREAAVAQLQALRALFAAVAPVAPAPHLVATVVAAVHGAVVADVLDDDTREALSEPFLSLLP